MDTQARRTYIALILCISLGLLLVLGGSIQFARFLVLDDKVLLLDAYRAVLWAFWPAFVALLVSLRRRALLPARWQWLALVPTLAMLVLASAIYANRWL